MQAVLKKALDNMTHADKDKIIVKVMNAMYGAEDGKYDPLSQWTPDNLDWVAEAIHDLRLHVEKYK